MKNSENDAVKEVEKKAKDVKVVADNEEQEKNNKTVQDERKIDKTVKAETKSKKNSDKVENKLTKEEIIVKCGSGRGTFYVRKDAMENENLPQ